MMVPLIFFGLLLWLGLQFRPKNREKWAYRRELVAPFARWVWSDVRFMARSLRSRLHRIDVDWDEVNF